MPNLRTMLLVVITASITLNLHAQTKSFEGLYKKYSKVDGVKTVNVGRTKIAMAKAVSSKYPEGLKEVKIISVKERSQSPKANMLDKDIVKMIGELPCTLLSESTIEGHAVRVYAHPHTDKGKVKDVVVYVTGPTQIMVVEIVGEFDKNDKFIKDIASDKIRKK